jgi:ketosteroid isomerase-like protein
LYQPSFEKGFAMKPIDVVRSYYAAFDTHDFGAARALMGDDFRFVGPMMEANSPEELFGKMKEFDCDFTNQMVHMAENGDTVAALFDCVFTRPFNATIRMSEWFTVKGGKIASANLVYDTRQMPTPSAS